MTEWRFSLELDKFRGLWKVSRVAELVGLDKKRKGMDEEEGVCRGSSTDDLHPWRRMEKLVTGPKLHYENLLPFFLYECVYYHSR